MKNILGLPILPWLNTFCLLVLISWTGHAADSSPRTRYTIRTDLAYRTEGTGFERCRLDLYHPENLEGFSTVVWFHGGGLGGGERYLPEALKEKGIAVVPVSYRLSPAVSYPAYVEDAAAAVAWVLAHIAEYGGDPRAVFVSGHSAGAYLAAMVGLDRRWLAEHGIDANRLAGIIPLSGQMVTHVRVLRERGLRDHRVMADDAAPIFHVRGDAPPLVLITGDRELELRGRHEENAFMWRMMKVAGHGQSFLFEMDGADHGDMRDSAYPLVVRQVRQITDALSHRRERRP